MDAYFGMLAPAGTPQPVIDKLHGEIVAVLKEPATRERLEKAGLDVVGSSPAEFGARMRADLERFARIAKSLGAKAE
jgi:tripartite-type tricarboxylate transporter receptor subunit TctC